MISIVAADALVLYVCCIGAKCALQPRLWFNIKISSYRYRKSHCGDNTIVRLSYLHNGISYTGKMISLYWISPQATMFNNQYRHPISYQCYCYSIQDQVPLDMMSGKMGLFWWFFFPFYEKNATDICTALLSCATFYNNHKHCSNVICSICFPYAQITWLVKLICPHW